jgi:hypothetical protein
MLGMNGAPGPGIPSGAKARSHCCWLYGGTEVPPQPSEVASTKRSNPQQSEVPHQQSVRLDEIWGDDILAQCRPWVDGLKGSKGFCYV